MTRASLRAFAIGLALTEALTVLAWATDTRSGAGSGDALRSGALVWLVAHGARIAVRGGAFALPPLAVTTGLLWLAQRAGAAVVRELQPRPVTTAAWLGAAVAGPYAVAATLLTGLARSDAAKPGPWRVLLVTLVLVGAAGAIGGVRARGGLALPDRANLVVNGAYGALATLAAGGAIGMAVALAAHFGRVSDLAGALRPGVLGGFVLLLLGVAYAPNAIVWCVAFAVGTGFAVGAGTSVAPTGISLGPLPAFPLLGVLPGAGDPPMAAWLLFAVPVAAGVVAGLLVGREGLTPARAAGWAALTGPVTGAAVALACVLAGGPAGPGRLGVTGPSPALAGLAVAEWVAFVAAATAALRAYRAGG